MKTRKARWLRNYVAISASSTNHKTNPKNGRLTGEIHGQVATLSFKKGEITELEPRGNNDFRDVGRNINFFLEDTSACEFLDDDGEEAGVSAAQGDFKKVLEKADPRT